MTSVTHGTSRNLRRTILALASLAPLAGPAAAQPALPMPDNHNGVNREFTQCKLIQGGGSKCDEVLQFFEDPALRQPMMRLQLADTAGKGNDWKICTLTGGVTSAYKAGNPDVTYHVPAIPLLKLREAVAYKKGNVEYDRTLLGARNACLAAFPPKGP